MSGWALDLGTTNTALARWDESSAAPELVELPTICRGSADGIESGRLVPTVVQMLSPRGLFDRIGAWPAVERWWLLGRRALIGKPALEENQAGRASFVPCFKAALDHEPLRVLARLGRHYVTAREAAHAFLRELLREAAEASGTRPRELVVTCPVVAFETYRAEVQSILRRLGVHRVRFLDEPVAAALGYGLGLARDRTALVIDIGGGTMHVVLVRLSASDALDGRAVVLAKRGRVLGGNAVDGWVLEEACRALGYDLAADEDDEVALLWRRLMLADACRVKEAVYFNERVPFLVTPPRAAKGEQIFTLTRDGLHDLLDKNGFFRALGASIDEVLTQAQAGPEHIDEVLLVGGSTLLPGVQPLLADRFGRGRLRTWHPFEAVAQGAACFAAGAVGTLDSIVHDYAFLTHDAKTGEPHYTVVVPRGTRFPTAPDLWRHELVPTCALGEPETVFKLLIAEIAEGDANARPVWDAAGNLHKVGAQGESRLVVPLNAARPTLGVLDPPHDPRDRRPRLDLAFGVNADRWLVATVRDLLAGRELMHEEPVVRLV
jgi:molecular chaperone DnaK (HSP70)